MKTFINYRSDDLFPIENLPLCIFSPKNNETQKRVGSRISHLVIDLPVLAKAGLLPKIPLEVLEKPQLNDFMALGKPSWLALRKTLEQLLIIDNPVLQNNASLRAAAFHDVDNVILHLPAAIGDYTDFYSSKEHASNVGTMFRDKNNPLLPNWLHLPVGYHGRASSVVVSGTEIVRPWGQIKDPAKELPEFLPSKQLDFELEMAYLIGKENAFGQRIRVEDAEDHIFGLTLMNDWSARDIQKWEYVPLGPFTAKNFATSISPWVVSLDVLQPFAVPSVDQQPKPLAYLQNTTHKYQSYDIHLTVELKPSGSKAWETICTTNAKHLYWTMAQQIAQHTVTGCNLRVGDLIASGTISGPRADSFGSLLELAWGGEKPLMIGGQKRVFLEDGDEVRMTGFCQGPQYRIGFGEVVGKVIRSKD